MCDPCRGLAQTLSSKASRGKKPEKNLKFVPNVYLSPQMKDHKLALLSSQNQSLKIKARYLEKVNSDLRAKLNPKLKLVVSFCLFQIHEDFF